MNQYFSSIDIGSLNQKLNTSQFRSLNIYLKYTLISKQINFVEIKYLYYNEFYGIGIC